MVDRLRWGILGTGNITHQFARGLRTSQSTKLVAVGSRKQETAQAFAESYHVPTVHGSYEALLANPEVEAVYNALPNSLHHQWTIGALQAGKHVLCEKPLATNLAEAEEMFDISEKTGRVLAEAFMYRSHPQTLTVLDMVRRGVIGELRLIRSSFCFRVQKTENNTRFRTDLAGGSLMDIGCYCINFSRMLTGTEPTAMHATGLLHSSGVDLVVSATLHFPGSVEASFTCGMDVQADNTAQICGNEGYLVIPTPWKPSSNEAIIHVMRSNPPMMDNPEVREPMEIQQTFRIDAGKDLFALEADDFATSVREGAPPRVGKEDTLGNMRVLDELRRQVGVVFEDG